MSGLEYIVASHDPGTSYSAKKKKKKKGKKETKLWKLVPVVQKYG